MTQRYQLLDVIEVANELGEGIIWDAQREVVWWTDIQGRKLYRLSPRGRQLSCWDTPKRLCCLTPVCDEDYLLVAFDSGLAFYDPETQWLEQICTLEPVGSGRRLNDGRTDRQGRFWVGGLVESGEANSAKLYCLDGDLTWSEKLSGLSISNGLCWSPDAAYLYHTDSSTGIIDRYEFNVATAELSDRVVFARAAKSHSPDGAIVDAQGGVWSAHWGGSRVVRYTQSGEEDLVIPLPVSQPTCVALGGNDLDTLFVTTAMQGLSQEVLKHQPSAGHVFVFKVTAQGIAEQPFKRTNTHSSFVDQ